MRLAVALLLGMGTLGLAEDLNLTLTAVTPEVVAGTPILLRATVETSGASADVPAISPAAGNFELWAANLVTGERTRYLGPQWSEDERTSSLQTVRQGTAAATTIKLLVAHNGRSVVFVPARWQFNIQYKGLGPDRPLYAQATVTVREPADDSEREWWKALQENPALAEAIQTGTTDSRIADQLEAMVRAHSDAGQANAAALTLGRYYLQTRKAPARALEFLRVAGGKKADPAMRREALAEAANALEATGAKFEADAVRKEVEMDGSGVGGAAAPAPPTGPAPSVGPVKPR